MDLDLPVLICGYGSAGKRHEKILKSLGIPDDMILTADPDESKGADYADLHEALVFFGPKDFSIVVLATPPNQHIEDMFTAIRTTGAYVMCEKPLCSLEHIGRARSAIANMGSQSGRVMVAYNYAFHPKLENVNASGKLITLNCFQYRENYPEWGILLDHVSHDLQIVSSALGYIPSPTSVLHIDNDYEETWLLNFEENISICETVTKHPIDDRSATLNVNGNIISIDADFGMYKKMWQYFLPVFNARGRFTKNTLPEAIAIQDVLWEINQMAREKYD